VRRLLVTLAAALTVSGICTALSSAAFTRATTVGANTLTVDTLANYFTATPGTAVQPGTSTPVASGNVDALSLALGTVPSARTFTNVFTVKNISAQTQTATLALSGVSQIASVVFASSGTGSATLAAGASTTVSVTTSSTVAGHGSGTIRLGFTGSTWLYRNYGVTLDEAPEAPSSLTATAKAAGAIKLSWTASSTTNLAGYNVYRSTGSAPVKLNGAPLSGTTYTDSATADGTTYTYTVRAVSSGSPILESVDSAGATAKADATPPSAPTAVALANGRGNGNAYISLANRSSVSVSVTLPSTSSSSDTVTVTLSAGAASASGTTAASAGAGTVTVSGIDAGSLADGTVSISATSTDAAGNLSSSATGSAPKDTVAPAAPGGSYVDVNNGADQIMGSSGAAEANATITARQTGPSASGPYTATASAQGAYAVTVARSDGKTNSPIAVTYTVTATDAAGNTSSGTTVSANDTR
jgi:hypothetical protein